MVKNLHANVGDVGSVPGSGRSLGEGKDNPLWYSCLGNPWTEEPGRLRSLGLHRVRHDCVTKHTHLEKYSSTTAGVHGLVRTLVSLKVPNLKVRM